MLELWGWGVFMEFLQKHLEIGVKAKAVRSI